jgi:uncharacterized protein (TIGR03067 family)
VPKIDLVGFEHKIVERRLVFRNGRLEKGTTAWEDERGRRDTRPAPSQAMIEEAIRTDKKRLQGTWSVVSENVGGQSRRTEGDSHGSWIIDGDKIVMQTDGRREGKFTIDPSKSPRQIDITVASSDGKKEETIRGVYELRGDDLYVCLASGDAPRPLDLRAASGTDQVWLGLKRERR